MPITADDFQVQVSWFTDTGLPADAVVNTWSFKATETGADLGALCDGIASFYQATRLMFANTMDGTADGMTMKVYALADPEPRAPVFETTASIGATGGGALPSEVAACLSFRSTLESGTPAARRRGRVFLGALDTGVTESSSGATFMASTDMTAFVDAAVTMADVLAALGWEWSIWSRVDDSLFPVVFVWMDNAFDTQRRRGPRSTFRQTGTVPA